jgi:hypothetical protein
LVSALRRYVTGDPRVEAVYVLAMGVDDGSAPDVIGVDLRAGVHTGEVLDRLAAALEPVAPRGLTLDLTILSEQSRLAALRVCAPIGAGGRVESLAARAGHDRAAAADLAAALLEARLFVPALGDPDAGTGAGLPVPRALEHGEPVRFPVTRIGGHDAIAAFSSWWSLLHADPPFVDQLVASGRALLTNWPEGVGLALDVGCLHAAVLAADQAAALRTSARSEGAQGGGGDGGYDGRSRANGA